MSEKRFVTDRKHNKNLFRDFLETRSLVQIGDKSLKSIKSPKTDILSTDICELLLEIGTQLACNQQMMKRLRTDPSNAVIIPRQTLPLKEIKLLGTIITRCKYYMSNCDDYATARATIDKLLLKSVCKLWEAANREKLILVEYEQYCVRQHLQSARGQQHCRIKSMKQPPDKNAIKNQRCKVVKLITDILSLTKNIDTHKVEKKNVKSDCAKLIRSQSQQKVKNNEIISERKPLMKKFTFPKSKSSSTFVIPRIFTTTENKNRALENHKIITGDHPQVVGKKISNHEQKEINHSERRILPLERLSEKTIVPMKNTSVVDNYKLTIEFSQVTKEFVVSSILDIFDFNFAQRNVLCEVGRTIPYCLDFSSNFNPISVDTELNNEYIMCDENVRICSDNSFENDIVPLEIPENITEDVFTQTDLVCITKCTSTRQFDLINHEEVKENKINRQEPGNIPWKFYETAKDQSTETDQNIQYPCNYFADKKNSFADGFCQVTEQNCHHCESSDNCSLTSSSEQFLSKDEERSNENFQYSSKYGNKNVSHWVSDESIYTANFDSDSFSNPSLPSCDSHVEMYFNRSCQCDYEASTDIPNDIVRALQLAEERGRNLYGAIQIYTFLNCLFMTKHDAVERKNQHKQSNDSLKVTNHKNTIEASCNIANNNNLNFALKEFTIEDQTKKYLHAEDRGNDIEDFIKNKRFYEGEKSKTMEVDVFTNSSILSKRNVLPFLYGAICFIVFWCLQFSITCEN